MKKIDLVNKLRKIILILFICFSFFTAYKLNSKDIDLPAGSSNKFSGDEWNSAGAQNFTWDVNTGETWEGTVNFWTYTYQSGDHVYHNVSGRASGPGMTGAWDGSYDTDPDTGVVWTRITSLKVIDADQIYADLDTSSFPNSEMDNYDNIKITMYFATENIESGNWTAIFTYQGADTTLNVGSPTYIYPNKNGGYSSYGSVHFERTKQIREWEADDLYGLGIKFYNISLTGSDNSAPVYNFGGFNYSTTNSPFMHKIASRSIVFKNTDDVIQYSVIDISDTGGSGVSHAVVTRLGTAFGTFTNDIAGQSFFYSSYVPGGTCDNIIKVYDRAGWTNTNIVIHAYQDTAAPNVVTAESNYSLASKGLVNWTEYNTYTIKWSAVVDNGDPQSAGLSHYDVYSWTFDNKIDINFIQDLTNSSNDSARGAKWERLTAETITIISAPVGYNYYWIRPVDYVSNSIKAPTAGSVVCYCYIDTDPIFDSVDLLHDVYVNNQGKYYIDNDEYGTEFGVKVRYKGIGLHNMQVIVQGTNKSSGYSSKVYRILSYSDGTTHNIENNGYWLKDTRSFSNLSVTNWSTVNAFNFPGYIDGSKLHIIVKLTNRVNACVSNTLDVYIDNSPVIVSNPQNGVQAVSLVQNPSNIVYYDSINDKLYYRTDNINSATADIKLRVYAEETNSRFNSELNFAVWTGAIMSGGVQDYDNWVGDVTYESPVFTIDSANAPAISGNPPSIRVFDHVSNCSETFSLASHFEADSTEPDDVSLVTSSTSTYGYPILRWNSGVSDAASGLWKFRIYAREFPYSGGGKFEEDGFTLIEDNLSSTATQYIHTGIKSFVTNKQKTLLYAVVPVDNVGNQKYRWNDLSNYSKYTAEYLVDTVTISNFTLSKVIGGLGIVITNNYVYFRPGKTNGGQINYQEYFRFEFDMGDTNALYNITNLRARFEHASYSTIYSETNLVTGSSSIPKTDFDNFNKVHIVCDIYLTNSSILSSPNRDGPWLFTLFYTYSNTGKRLSYMDDVYTYVCDNESPEYKGANFILPDANSGLDAVDPQLGFYDNNDSVSFALNYIDFNDEISNYPLNGVGMDPSEITYYLITNTGTNKSFPVSDPFSGTKTISASSPQGTNILVLRISDYLHNYTYITDQFVVDTIAPAAPYISFLTDGDTGNIFITNGSISYDDDSAIKIIWSTTNISDPYLYSFLMEKFTTSAPNWPIGSPVTYTNLNYNGLSEGTNVFRIVAFDRAGNRSNPYRDAIIIKDTVKPSVSVVSPTNSIWASTNLAKATVKIYVTDNNFNSNPVSPLCLIKYYFTDGSGGTNYKLSADGGFNSGQIFELDITNFSGCAEGFQNFILEVYDKSGNKQPVSASYIFDNMAPTNIKIVSMYENSDYMYYNPSIPDTIYSAIGSEYYWPTEDLIVRVSAGDDEINGFVSGLQKAYYPPMKGNANGGYTNVVNGSGYDFQYKYVIEKSYVGTNSELFPGIGIIDVAGNSNTGPGVNFIIDKVPPVTNGASIVFDYVTNVVYNMNLMQGDSLFNNIKVIHPIDTPTGISYLYWSLKYVNYEEVETSSDTTKVGPFLDVFALTNAVGDVIVTKDDVENNDPTTYNSRTYFYVWLVDSVGNIMNPPIKATIQLDVFAPSLSYINRNYLGGVKIGWQSFCKGTTNTIVAAESVDNEGSDILYRFSLGYAPGYKNTMSPADISTNFYKFTNLLTGKDRYLQQYPGYFYGVVAYDEWNNGYNNWIYVDQYGENAYAVQDDWVTNVTVIQEPHFTRGTTNRIEWYKVNNAMDGFFGTNENANWGCGFPDTPYKVVCSTNSNFSTIDFDSGWIAGTLDLVSSNLYYTFSGLDDAEVYYYRVYLRDKLDNITESSLCMVVFSTQDDTIPSEIVTNSPTFFNVYNDGLSAYSNLSERLAHAGDLILTWHKPLDGPSPANKGSSSTNRPMTYEIWRSSYGYPTHLSNTYSNIGYQIIATLTDLTNSVIYFTNQYDDYRYALYDNNYYYYYVLPIDDVGNKNYTGYDIDWVQVSKGFPFPIKLIVADGIIDNNIINDTFTNGFSMDVIFQTAMAINSNGGIIRFKPESSSVFYDCVPNPYGPDWGDDAEGISFNNVAKYYYTNNVPSDNSWDGKASLEVAHFWNDDLPSPKEIGPSQTNRDLYFYIDTIEPKFASFDPPMITNTSTNDAFSTLKAKLNIAFDDSMKITNLAAIRVRDQLNRTIGGTYELINNDTILQFTPDADTPFMICRQYYVDFTAAYIQDDGRNFLDPTQITNYKFKFMLNPDIGGIVEELLWDTELKPISVDFPPNAVDKEIYLEILPYSPINNTYVSLSPSRSPADSSLDKIKAAEQAASYIITDYEDKVFFVDSTRAIDKYFPRMLLMYSSQSGKRVIEENLEMSAKLTVPYYDDETHAGSTTIGDGILDDSIDGFSDEFLYLFRLEVKDDVNKSRWYMIPTDNDRDNNILSAHIDKMGMYTMLISKKPTNLVDSIVVYPNPFNPVNGEELTIDYFIEEVDGINVRILIYTINGTLVRKIEFTAGQDNARYGNNTYFWDGRNGNNDIVEDGIYFLSIETYNGRKVSQKVLEKICVFNY